jgi:predicted phosphodiesterase
MLYGIGDVHGKIREYEELIKKIRESHNNQEDIYTFQVGDMGVGFKGVFAPKVGPNDLWIAGNHDDALVCEKCPGNLGDFGCREIGDQKVFWVRGADSYDKMYRKEGISWWAYEELTYPQLMEAIELFIKEKPDIMITHDCPAFLYPILMHMQNRDLRANLSKTPLALNNMFEIHQPKQWLFGHHHISYSSMQAGTKFTCLNELEYVRVF